MPTYLDLVDATAEHVLNRPIRAVAGLPEEQPLSKDVARVADESVMRLIQEGIVRPPSAPFPADILKRGPLYKPSRSVLEALLDERGQGP